MPRGCQLVGPELTRRRHLDCTHSGQAVQKAHSPFAATLTISGSARKNSEKQIPPNRYKQNNLSRSSHSGNCFVCRRPACAFIVRRQRSLRRGSGGPSTCSASSSHLAGLSVRGMPLLREDARAAMDAVVRLGTHSFDPALFNADAAPARVDTEGSSVHGRTSQVECEDSCRSCFTGQCRRRQPSCSRCNAPTAGRQGLHERTQAYRRPSSRI